MAHNKVFGICESKCRVEVPSKESFESTVTEIIENAANLANEMNGKSNDGHNHDDRYYTETEVNSLFNTKLANYYTKSNFAVLTGNLTLNKNNTAQGYYNTVNLNYPSGFNKNNCVVLSAMEILTSGSTSAVRTGFIGFLTGEQSALARMSPAVTLNDSNVVVSANSASEITIGYKVILFKYA